jgi:hypothetical protein
VVNLFFLGSLPRSLYIHLLALTQDVVGKLPDDPGGIRRLRSPEIRLDSRVRLASSTLPTLRSQQRFFAHLNLRADFLNLRGLFFHSGNQCAELRVLSRNGCLKLLPLLRHR